ncbi:hypothetical protein CC78DRAFT_578510 [Lojkania enalia]|uniref:Uncharacterized protein n=1 Tax=Lojkania enalia TaxID=147567 RepID=A0A9P4KCM3_9PLEO|nr:hypothetical protein CC78DRAFT_578510 [Didymosphaeria enalia]
MPETIGITTLFYIRLILAPSHVNLTFLPVESNTEALDSINRYCQDLENDFVEGLIHGEKASIYRVISKERLSANQIYPDIRFSAPAILSFTYMQKKPWVKPNASRP